MRQILFILFIFLTRLSLGQDFVLDNLANTKWTAEIKVTDFNIGELKEIGLAKLKVPIDSIKNDVSIWEFNDNNLKILNYTNEKGMDSLIVKCRYEYDDNKKLMRIFHFSQDSNFWEYSLQIDSNGYHIMMTRKN